MLCAVCAKAGLLSNLQTCWKELDSCSNYIDPMEILMVQVEVNFLQCLLTASMLEGQHTMHNAAPALKTKQQRVTHKGTHPSQEFNLGKR